MSDPTRYTPADVIAKANQPLPAVPELSYDGGHVRWEPWEPRPVIFHLDQTCEDCAAPGPGLMTFGTRHPAPGETVESDTPVRAKRSGRIYSRTARVPAWPVYRLYATLCQRCRTIRVIDTKTDLECETTLCDSCDTLCSIGVTPEEAAANLVALGGWTKGVGDEQWDLCPACNPTARPLPRSLATVRAAKAAGAE